MVVTARNPVHSVLFLILAFFNAAALFLIAGAEFLAMILVIVYVGAVAVLFLFVVMMLDVDFAELREGYQRYMPVGAAVGAVLCVELLLVLTGWKFAPDAVRLQLSAAAPTRSATPRHSGSVLYTDYVFLFQAAGLILLVAMIGAIVLTHRDRKTSRHQVIREQTERDSGRDAGTDRYRPRRRHQGDGLLPPEAEGGGAGIGHDATGAEAHGDGAHGGGHHAPETR